MSTGSGEKRDHLDFTFSEYALSYSNNSIYKRRKRIWNADSRGNNLIP